MKATRGSILAGLVLVAIATPVTAYALTAGDDSGDPAPAATHGPPATHPSPTAEPNDDPGTGHADEASAPGRAHAEAMKAWARCVADAASGPKVEGAAIPPKLNCGEKPMAPGRAKHAPSSGLAAHGHGPATHGRGR